MDLVWLKVLRNSCTVPYLFTTWSKLYHLQGQNTVNDCIGPHLQSKHVTLVLNALSWFTLILVWGLYARIIMSFWSLRRRRSIKRAESKFGGYQGKEISFYEVRCGICRCNQSLENAANEDAYGYPGIELQTPQRESRKQSVVPSVMDNINRIGRYLSASKYVLVILMLFTICWLPFTVGYSSEFIFHAAGWHTEYIQVR